MDAHAGAGSYREWDFDNFRFLAWELYLLCMSIAMKHEAFSIALQLIGQPYYDERAGREGRDVMTTFAFLYREIGSLDRRNQRLGLRRRSLQADMLKTRFEAGGWQFIDVMQADFLLFMRSMCVPSNDVRRWYPDTLGYMGHGQHPFRIFGRCVSKSYAEKILPLLGVDTPGLKKVVDGLRTQDGSSSYLRFGYSTLDAGKVLGIDRWATMA
jgi:hypothetical protein